VFKEPSNHVSAFKRHLILFLVTGAGLGRVPWFPGTVGTLAAIPLSLGVNRIAIFSLPLALLILGGSILAAIALANRGAQILGSKDPAVIVIDEIAGFLIANFLAAPEPVSLFLAFVLFRFFDIGKIFPASRFEKLPGGIGIVLDDVVAGVYTFAILRLLTSWNLL
jgi:phosphatidylglycerophosphatase A